MTLQELKQTMQGEWISLAPEVRPSGIKSPDGSIKPFYLTRAFTYAPDDRFELTVVNLADPYGKVPLAKLLIRGHMVWQGDHPIAAGAQNVTFLADDEYEVTPLFQGFAGIMNQAASKGFDTWEIHRPQSILRKAFPPFGLKAEEVFAEYDLVYLRDNLLFWGARHVDGRGFDTEGNRPTNLQIPLIRKEV